MHPLPRSAGLFLASVCALVPLATAAPVSARTGTAHPVAPAGAGSPVAPTAETAQEFIDTRVPELLEEHGAPGVAVTVVAGGAEVASGAHGVADLADGTPLDEEAHGFPTGSVCKSFTAASVLQLVEQGEVDLHEDVNTYLPEEFRVPDTHPGEPVTLHHLLTHTPGFDERTELDGAEDPDGQRDLEEFLSEVTPERVFPPGRYSAYSNYGLGLAGLVVQEVSGVPFEEYVERNLLEPLGMDDSAFGQIRELAGHHDLATTHGADGSAVTQDHLPLVPAGAAVTTTGDMGRFMLALLEGGELDGERVLSQESVDLMLGRRFEHHPDATAVGYGAYEMSYGPPRGVGHGGDLPGLHVGYLLLPELDTGVFVAANGDDTVPVEGWKNLRSAVLLSFADEFGSAGPPPAEADPAADLSAYSGTYIPTRRPSEGMLQLLTVLDCLTVRDAGDGTLRLSGFEASDERFLPAGDHLFVGEDSGERLGFGAGDRGAASLYLDRSPTDAFERTSVVDSPVTHMLVAAAALLFLLTGPVHLWRPGGAVRTTAAVLGSLTALACLAGTGLVVYALSDADRMVDWLLGGSAALFVPYTLVVPLALATTGTAVRAWRESWWGPVRRVHYSLVPVAAFAVVAVAVRYHLIWPLG